MRRARCLRKKILKKTKLEGTQGKDAESRSVSEIPLLSRIKASVLAVQRPGHSLTVFDIVNC